MGYYGILHYFILVGSTHSTKKIPNIQHPLPLSFPSRFFFTFFLLKNQRPFQHFPPSFFLCSRFTFSRRNRIIHLACRPNMSSYPGKNIPVRFFYRCGCWSCYKIQKSCWLTRYLTDWLTIYTYYYTKFQSLGRPTTANNKHKLFAMHFLPKKLFFQGKCLTMQF